MMVLRMFLVLFGISMGWILGSVFATDIVAPYLKYWGLKIRVKLARKIQVEMVEYYPPGERA